MSNLPSNVTCESQDGDFVLESGSMWVTVGNLSVYIVKTDEGVAVDVYPHHDEMNMSLGGTWVLFQEGESDE